MSRALIIKESNSPPKKAFDGQWKDPAHFEAPGRRFVQSCARVGEQQSAATAEELSA